MSARVLALTIPSQITVTIKNVESLRSLVSKTLNLEELNMLHKKSLFIRLDGLCISDFPRLTKEDIISYITFGTYLLRKSLSYLAEHMKDGIFEIMVAKERFEF